MLPAPFFNGEVDRCIGLVAFPLITGICYGLRDLSIRYTKGCMEMSVGWILPGNIVNHQHRDGLVLGYRESQEYVLQ